MNKEDKIRAISEAANGNIVFMSVMHKLYDAEPDLALPTVYHLGDLIQATWQNDKGILYFDNEDGYTVEDIGPWQFFYMDRPAAIGFKYDELDQSLSVPQWVFDKLENFKENDG